MEEIQDWASSDDGTVTDPDIDLQDWNDDEHSPYRSGSIPKLQFRKDVSKGRLNEKMGMAEVIEKKGGGMWTITGIIRKGKLYCSIEEIVFLAERGALFLLDYNDITLTLKDNYTKLAYGKHGCCWESFEAYGHLKLLGYILGRYDVARHGDGSRYNSSSNHMITSENNGELESGLEENISIICQLKGYIKLDFDVYLPNRKLDADFLLKFLRKNAV